LSTSAIKTIVEHNCLIDRTPLTAPRVAPEHSSRSAVSTAFAASPAHRTGGPAFAEGFDASSNTRPAERSRARGGIVDFSIQSPAFFHRLALQIAFACSARWKLIPNPIGSDTFCRKPASAQEWRPVPRRPSKEGLHEPAWTTPLSQDRPRAAPRTSSRKEMRSAAPKVPSIDKPP